MITNDIMDVLIIIGIIFSVIGIILAIACLIREIILDLQGGRRFRVIVEKVEATEVYEDEEYEKDKDKNEENTEKNILQQSK